MFKILLIFILCLGMIDSLTCLLHLKCSARVASMDTDLDVSVINPTQQAILWKHPLQDNQRRVRANIWDMGILGILATAGMMIPGVG